MDVSAIIAVQEQNHLLQARPITTYQLKNRQWPLDDGNFRDGGVAAQPVPT